VVCDALLRIWHVNLGASGSREDITIYNQSKFFTEFRVGKWPEVNPEIIIDDFVLKWFTFFVMKFILK
jgi:hypothetical protein